MLQEGAKTTGIRFKVLMSFEYNRKLLPKDKVGILVTGEKFTITTEGIFRVEKLNSLSEKGYIKLLPRKKRRKKKNKKKAKAAR